MVTAAIPNPTTPVASRCGRVARSPPRRSCPISHGYAEASSMGAGCQLVVGCHAASSTQNTSTTALQPAPVHGDAPGTGSAPTRASAWSGNWLLTRPDHLGHRGIDHTHDQGAHPYGRDGLVAPVASHTRAAAARSAQMSCSTVSIQPAAGPPAACRSMGIPSPPHLDPGRRRRPVHRLVVSSTTVSSSPAAPALCAGWGIRTGPN